jgi:hypothetical protein
MKQKLAKTRFLLCFPTEGSSVFSNLQMSYFKKLEGEEN